MVNPWIAIKSAMIAGPRERCSIAAFVLSVFSVLAFSVFLINMISYSGSEYYRGSIIEAYLFFYALIGIVPTVLTIILGIIGLKSLYRKLAIISLSIKVAIVFGIPLLTLLVNLIIHQ